MGIQILVVEDDAAMANGIANELALSGYVPKLAGDADSALASLSTERIDLVLLDVNLPDEDGFSLSKKVKQQWNVPFIFLTARDLESDEARGFDLGADDYITKPFSPKLLLKRIEAVLRRFNKGNASCYDDGYLSVDFDSFSATKDGEPVALSPTEYKLLSRLIDNPGRVLTRNVLLEHIWDVDENFVDEHALTVSMGRLRKKIEPIPGRYIKTVYGMGYMWMGDCL